MDPERHTVPDTPSHIPNKTVLEIERAERMGWRLFNRARVQQDVYEAFKRRGWPNLDVWQDEYHNRGHVNDRFNEALLKVMFDSWGEVLVETLPSQSPLLSS